MVSPPPAGEAPAPPAVEAASPAPVEAASPALAAEVAAEEMGPLLGACYRCTCLVHEADIIEGYAVLNDARFECEQIHHADSCQEYARTHQEDIAAAAAAGRPIRKRACG